MSNDDKEFEKWIIDSGKGALRRLVLNHTKQAWQAGRESMVKERDELKDRIKELESYLIEVVNSMKNNHSYHGDGNKWQCDDEDCSGCFFERKLKRINNDE